MMTTAKECAKKSLGFGRPLVCAAFFTLVLPGTLWQRVRTKPAFSSEWSGIRPYSHEDSVGSSGKSYYDFEACH